MGRWEGTGPFTEKEGKDRGEGERERASKYGKKERKKD